MRHIDLETARIALERWGGDPSTLEHLATSGNAVYAYRADGARRILRLTDPEHRTAAQNAAEMEFLVHLDRCGVPVSVPVRSLAGRLVEQVGADSASVLTWADGISVGQNGPHWNEPFFRSWGRALGEIHAAARAYAGPPRWAWQEEGLLTRAKELFPAQDVEERAALDRVCARLAELPRTRENFGMTHADFAPQNFRYDPSGRITTFDFGNCCHHWFVSDLVISLSTLRRRPERDLYRLWILDGYRSVAPIDERIWSAARTFLELRIFYVYLSRLKKFGAFPTAGEQATLEELRARVHERLDWP